MLDAGFPCPPLHFWSMESRSRWSVRSRRRREATYGLWLCRDRGRTRRVARESRIWVEGVHDAELVEQVWGDDLGSRAWSSNVSTVPMGCRCRARLQPWTGSPTRRAPRPCRRRLQGVTSCERGQPSRAGLSAHPRPSLCRRLADRSPRRPGYRCLARGPRGTPWKEGICEALGWPTSRPPTSELPGFGSAQPCGRTPTSSRPSCALSRSSSTSSPADVHQTGLTSVVRVEEVWHAGS